jgi:hypothetical protein
MASLVNGKETGRPGSARWAMQGTQTSLAVIKAFTGEKTLTLHSQYHSPFLYKKAGENQIVLVDHSGR